MKVQLIGGPNNGAWADISEGQHTLTVGVLSPQKLMTAADAALPTDAPTFHQYTYHLTAHDDATFTMEYMG